MFAYFSAMSLIAAATQAAFRLAATGRGELSSGTRSLMTLTGALGGLVYSAGFLTGFFGLEWWMPIAALPVSWICGAIIYMVVPAMLAPVTLAVGAGVLAWALA